jgi:hypothetical protein
VREIKVAVLARVCGSGDAEKLGELGFPGKRQGARGRRGLNRPREALACGPRRSGARGMRHDRDAARAARYGPESGAARRAGRDDGRGPPVSDRREVRRGWADAGLLLGRKRNQAVRRGVQRRPSGEVKGPPPDFASWAA